MSRGRLDPEQSTRVVICHSAPTPMVMDVQLALRRTLPARSRNVDVSIASEPMAAWSMSRGIFRLVDLNDVFQASWQHCFKRPTGGIERRQKSPGHVVPAVDDEWKSIVLAAEEGCWIREVLGIDYHAMFCGNMENSFDRHVQRPHLACTGLHDGTVD